MAVTPTYPGQVDYGDVSWAYNVPNTTHSLTFTTNFSNEVIMVYIGNAALAPTHFHTVTAMTGGGLTWQKYAARGVTDGARVPGNPTAHQGFGIEVWWSTAPVPIPSLTITVTLSGSTSNGYMNAFGVIGCANPYAPFDTNAVLPVITNGMVISGTPQVLHFSATAIPVLMLQFWSASEESGTLIKPNAVWQSMASYGSTGGVGYPAFSVTPYQTHPNTGSSRPPVAYGCNPFTATSFTATWDAVPPTDYVQYNNTAVTVTNQAAVSRPFISIITALVGTPLVNPVTYEVHYWRDDYDGADEYVMTSATSLLIEGLDAGFLYDWNVRTIDGIDTWPYYVSAPDVLCPLFDPAPAITFAIDDVVCMVEGGLDSNLVSLRWSDDGGHSFGNPVSRNMGNTGQYTTSLQWQRLAYARERIWELSWTVPAPAALQGCWVELQAART